MLSESIVLFFRKILITIGTLCMSLWNDEYFNVVWRINTISVIYKYLNIIH